MRKTKILLSLIMIFCLFPVMGDDSSLATVDLIEKLHAGDDSVIPELTNRREEVLKLLKNPLGGTDVEKLLRGLGADQYTEREDATRQLIKLMPAVLPAVKSYMEKNRQDPEIRDRCRQILQTPLSVQQQQASVQTVKFLITLDNLDSDTINHFAKSYRDIFDSKNTEFFKPYDQPENKKILQRFISQFTRIPEATEKVIGWLKDKPDPVFLDVAVLLLEENIKVNLPLLLNTKSHLPEILELMLGDCREKVTEENWIQLIKAITESNNIDHRLLRLINGKRDLPLPFRKNAVLFLKSDNNRMIVLGLYLYQGNYSEIRETLSDIFQHKITSDQEGSVLDNALCELKLTPENAYVLLEIIADNPQSNFPCRSISFISRQTDKLPKDKIMALIKDSPVKGKWAEILGEKYPELRPELSSLLYQELPKIDNAGDFYNYLAVLNDPLGFSFKPGALDDIWLKFIEKEREKYHQLYRSAVIIKVSPALLLRELEEISDNVEKSNNDQIVQCVQYLLQSKDLKVRDGIVAFIWEKIKNDKSGKKDYYNRVALFQAIIDAKPDTADELLLKKAKWFLTNPSEKGHALYYCMVLSPGTHGDKFTEITVFFLKNESEIIKIMKQDCMNAEDFPFVAIFAMKKEFREKYGDLLKERLLHDVSVIENSPHLLQCAVIAGSALDLKHPALDKALISLIQRPPEYLHYMDETMLSLGKNRAHLVPKLLEMDKGVTKAPFPFDTALFIDRDNPKVIDYGRDLVLHSESHAVACNAALGLAIVGKMMPLKDIPEERIKWLLRISKDSLSDTEKFINAVDDTEDERALLKLLVPLFSKVAEIQTYDAGLTNLFWRKPENQRIAIAEIISMIESENDKQCTLGLNLLASAPEAAADYIDRIHACLKKENDIHRRKSLLWAISNIGPAAAAMQETVSGISDSDNHVVFCLANICADPADRKKNLMKLIEAYQEKPNSTTIRMIGLVKGQKDITHSFLKGLIQSVLDPKTEADKKLSYYSACEGVWGLSREGANEDTFRIYADILKRADEDQLTVADDIVDAVLWSVRTHYSERLPECRELIEKLPFRFRLGKSYHRTIEQLKQGKQ